MEARQQLIAVRRGGVAHEVARFDCVAPARRTDRTGFDGMRELAHVPSQGAAAAARIALGDGTRRGSRCRAHASRQKNATSSGMSSSRSDDGTRIGRTWRRYRRSAEPPLRDGTLQVGVAGGDDARRRSPPSSSPTGSSASRAGAGGASPVLRAVARRPRPGRASPATPTPPVLPSAASPSSASRAMRRRARSRRAARAAPRN